MIIFILWTAIAIGLIAVDDVYSRKHFVEEWQNVLIAIIFIVAIIAFILGGHKIINPALDSSGMQETNPTWHLAILICVAIGIDVAGIASIGHLIKMLIDHKGKL